MVHGFEVEWMDATGIPAKVIDFKFGGDGANEEAIRGSMGTIRHPIASGRFRSHPELPITSRCDRPTPKPTSTFGNPDFREKPQGPGHVRSDLIHEKQ